MIKVKTNTLIAAAFAVAVTPLLGVTAYAQAVNPSPDRLIVTFKDSVDAQDIASVKNLGAEPVKKLGLVNGLVVTVPNEAVVNKLKHLQDVERVEVDAIAHVAAPASTRTGTTQPVAQPVQTVPWGVNRIDAPKAWATSRGSNVKVAVLDTGIDKSHPDLVDNIAGGTNYVESGRGARLTLDPTAWSDDNGHGTHVSGTIAAADNTIGVVGVAPQAKLYGVKVLNSAGSGYVSDIVSGIEWSVNNDMQVISMSLSVSTDVQALHEAVDVADAAGVVVVAAAGNTGDGIATTNNVGYPAAYDSVVAVAATDSLDRIASFSSDGPSVEIAAPGVNINSTARGGSYASMNGTSMATPHVSGVVANALSAPIPAAADLDQNGLWSRGEIRSYLQLTADELGDPGRDVFFGYGLVDTEEVITGIQTQ